MGRQSARIYFRGKDHKEIYFDGHYHDQMYLMGGVGDAKLVWEKLSSGIGDDMFVFTIKGPLHYGSFYMSIKGVVNIDWGDGHTEEVNCTEFRKKVMHAYSRAVQTYTVMIKGVLTDISFYQSGVAYDKVEVEMEILTKFPSSMYAVTSMANMFCGCASVGVPADLLENCPNVETIQCFFKDCKRMRRIPGGLFDNQTKVADMNEAFYNCEALEEIPGGLFGHCTAVAKVENLFRNCKALQDIPEGLFDCFTEAWSMNSVFYGCISLASIPHGLFDRTQKVTVFGDTFNGCTSLVSIPEGLFDNFPRAIYQRTFAGCRSITSKVPELWKHQTTYDSNGCFSGCTLAENYNDIPLNWRM